MNIKNILILTGEWQDVTITSSYSGLLRLGYNVHIFPFKDDYKNGVREPPYCIFYNDTENVPYDNILENVKKGYYDLLLMGSIQLDLKYRDFYRTILDLESCPPVAVFSAHSDGLNYDYKSFCGDHYLCEFRLEMYQPEDTVYPIFFPTEKEFFVPFDSNNKKYDVFYVFGSKFQHPCYYRRLITYEIIKDCFPNSIVNKDAQLSINEYMEKLSQSWIGISIRGVGLQTSRYYEVPAFGAYLVAEKTNLVRYNDFVDGEQVTRFKIEFDDSYPEKIVLYDMVSKISQLLANKDKLGTMIVSAQNHMENFTVEKMCSYILNAVGGVNDKNN